MSSLPDAAPITRRTPRLSPRPRRLRGEELVSSPNERRRQPALELRGDPCSSPGTPRAFPANRLPRKRFHYNGTIHMNLEQVARRAKVSTATVSRVLNNASVVKELDPRARDEGDRGAEVPPQSPRPQPGGRQEPHHRRHRLQHGEPVLLRHLQDHRSRRSRQRLRSGHGQHRLPRGATGHQRPSDDRPARGGPGRHRFRNGAGAHRRAGREPHPGRLLRRRHPAPEHHQHPRQLPPRHRKGGRLPAQPRPSPARVPRATMPSSAPSTSA